MAKVARLSRKEVSRGVLNSLRQSYAEANRQAAALVRAYGDHPLPLIDIIGEIERGADRGNQIALAANAKAVDRTRP